MNERKWKKKNNGIAPTQQKRLRKFLFLPQPPGEHSLDNAVVLRGGREIIEEGGGAPASPKAVMPLPSPSPSPSSSLSASAAAAAAAATAATAPAPLSSRLMSLLLVILGANFLILLVYQVSWRVSSKVVAVEEEGGGGGGGGGLFFRTVDSPRPLPAFLGQVSMPEDEQTKEEDVEEGTWPPGAVSKSDKESQRPSPVPLRSEAKVDWKPPRRPPSKNLDLSAYESLMEDRRARLEAGCNEMRRRGVPPTKNYPNVIVMKEKDVVWCPVFKAASSTWLKYLFETSSLTEASG